MLKGQKKLKYHDKLKTETISVARGIISKIKTSIVYHQQNQDQYRIYRMVGTWENFAAKYVKIQV